MATPTRTFAERYVELTNAGSYAELQTLFADDAVFLGPQQRVLRGAEEIGRFYQSFLPTITPRIRLASFVEQDNVCVYELEAVIAGDTEYRLGAIDHATLDADGKVA